jgi:transcriptional regulator with XRE-family HTH domain
MTQTSQKIKKALFNYRRKNKLTQQDLADQVGVNRMYISRLENSQNTPAQTKFFKLLKIIGCLN